MNAKGRSADRIKWLKSENQRVTGEIVQYKRKHEELTRRLKEVTEQLNNRDNQLDTLKKRCEETRLQLTEMAANEKKIAAIHELEKTRYTKIRKAVEEHKDRLQQAVIRKSFDKPSNHATSPAIASPDQLSYASCLQEYQLAEKERCRDDLKRLLAKRDQEIVIRRNHNAARIVRMRKLLQSNEAKRTLCKEQLAALRSKTSRQRCLY